MAHSFVVLCPTYDAAVTAWNNIRHSYPVWVKSSRRPLSLTAYTGVRYTFHSENAGNHLKGLSGQFIGLDEMYEQMEAFEHC